MSIRIVELSEYDARLTDSFAHLLPQLSATATPPTEAHIRQIIEREDTHLLIAEQLPEGRIVGTLTLLVVDIPTHRKAWIEDVVADESVRGQGVGRALVEHGIALARQHGATTIDLTSRASRQVARALYRKCGFEEVDTTLFRLLLDK